MSIAAIIISLFAFILFTTPIIADFNKLKKHISLHDNVIYTGIKTLIYIGYPYFFVFFISIIRIPDPNAEWGDFCSPDALNQDVVEYVAWFLFIGGIAALMYAKYRIFQFFEVKLPIVYLLFELFYAPFVFMAMVIALW